MTAAGGVVPGLEPRFSRLNIGGRARRSVALILMGSMGALSVAVLVGTGQPLLAMAPIALASIVYAAWHLPIRHSVFSFMGLVILADVMPRSPTSAIEVWRSPVAPLRALFLDNLNKLTGIEALRFSGTEVVLGALLALAAVRTMSGEMTDRRGRVPGVSPIAATLLLSFVTVLLLEVWGISRGGDFRQSLWQLRQLLWFPIVAALVTYSVRGMRDLVTATVIVTAIAGLKVAVGFYYYLLWVGTGLGKPHSVTSHADTMLFVVVIAIWTAYVFFRPTLGRLITAALINGWMLFGIVINNRRTAYVGLAAVMLVMFPLLPQRSRHALLRVALCMLPFAALYLVAGRNRSSGFFAPAGAVMSVMEQNDGSSATRDIENYNLTITLKQHLVTGSGWGHPYSEVSQAYDVTTFFEQYRYVAHNSVLWLWSVAGLLGFTALWLHLGLGVFFARRSHYLARTVDERIAAYGAIATYVAFMILAWSDMGTQSWTAVILVSLALAASGKLATITGAWPAELQLIGRSDRPAAR